MPGSSPYNAFSAFITPLVDALKCVTRPAIAVSQGGKNHLQVRHLLYLTGHRQDNDGYLRLGRSGIEFRARMKYMIITDERPDYGTPGGEYPSVCRAAIVTAVDDDVSLCVLNPEGMFFNRSVLQDEDHRGGTWHWPERV